MSKLVRFIETMALFIDNLEKIFVKFAIVKFS